MACYTFRLNGMSEEQREAQIDAALRRLEQYLDAGTVKVQIGPQGGVVLIGWQDRDDVSDTCAVRSLQIKGSDPLARAIAAAEREQHVTYSRQAVTAGWHSHDGGHTWGRH